MRNIFLLYFCILLTSFCFSQSKEIDSLQNLLKNEKNEQVKNKLLVSIGYSYLINTVYYDSSYIYLKKANDLAKKSRNENLYAITLFDIGNVFLLSGNSDEAIEYYRESIFLLKELNEIKQVSMVHNNIARIYFDEKKYTLAEEELKKGIKSAIKTNNQRQIASSTVNLAETYLKKGDYAKVKPTILKSKRIYDSLNIEDHLLNRILSEINLIEGNIEQSKVKANLALSLAKKGRDLHHLLDSYLLLSKISEAEKDYKNAMFYKDKALEFKDSIIEVKKNNEVKKAQLNNTLTQKETKITTLSQTNKYLNTIYVLVAIGVILIIILISRQIKISRMTKDIYNMQKGLFEETTVSKNANLFDAAKSADDELQ